MQYSPDQLYAMVKDIKTRKQFDALIKTRSLEYDKLFDDETIGLLIVDELGRNTPCITPISGLKPETDSTIVGKITALQDLKTFTKKNGSPGKVLNLFVEDNTESCRVVLWNEDAEKGTNLTIGTTVKIVNGYVKAGHTGIEINLGRWSMLEVQPQEHIPETYQTKNKKQTQDIIQGTLIRREPTRAFFKENGEFGFVTTITLQEQGMEQQLTVWGEQVKDIQKFKLGEYIQISNIKTKQYNGKTEIHLTDESTIQRR